jgi:hypothetical protein
MTSIVTGQAGLYAFDPSLGFNDLVNPANYFFKVEEVIPGRTPTVSHIIVSYRDLGLVTVTFTLTGTNDLQQIISNSVTVVLGNRVPTGRIMTINTIGLSLTGQNLQLSFNKAPGAGSLALVKILLVGTVEHSEGTG